MVCTAGEGGWPPELFIQGREAPDPAQLVVLTWFCISQVLLIITSLAIPCSPLLLPKSWNPQQDS